MKYSKQLAKLNFDDVSVFLLLLLFFRFFVINIADGQGEERQAWGKRDREGGVQRQRRDEGLRLVLGRSALPRCHPLRCADRAGRAHGAGTYSRSGPSTVQITLYKYCVWHRLAQMGSPLWQCVE